MRVAPVWIAASSTAWRSSRHEGWQPVRVLEVWWAKPCYLVFFGLKPSNGSTWCLLVSSQAAEVVGCELQHCVHTPCSTQVRLPARGSALGVTSSIVHTGSIVSPNMMVDMHPGSAEARSCLGLDMLTAAASAATQYLCFVSCSLWPELATIDAHQGSVTHCRVLAQPKLFSKENGPVMHAQGYRRHTPPPWTSHRTVSC